jgi:hypothetical protein
MRSEAYRLRLVGRLWWANLIFMVLPATLATVAAVCAAGKYKDIAAWLAGGAAVLTAIHKTLKCDEYQAECLRLSRRYQGMATLADAALESEATSDGLPSPQKVIAAFSELEESATAVLPDRYLRAAERSIREQDERHREDATHGEPHRLGRKATA